MIDPMVYLDGMERTDPGLMEKVLSASSSYRPEAFTERDVARALDSSSPDLEDLGALLSPAAEGLIEEMAQRAMEETRKHFGNSVSMFTPLYISNFCDNRCIYCGFNRDNDIHRARLDFEEIEREMDAIADTGLEEVLILTGESRRMSDPEYIGEACRIASKRFRVVGLEVYPMNSSDYAYLHSCGADFVTVFQETYDPETYGRMHLGGCKRVMPYRFNAQERAVRGGMRGVGFGALLGLGDFRRDAFATAMHAGEIQRKYPHAEIAFSCPRLRPIVNNSAVNPGDVHETQLLQVICAYRLYAPYAGITISSRERAGFRDNVIRIAATKISAGVDVGIGGHSSAEDKGDGQFEISDGRTVPEIFDAIRSAGLQPVMSDYIYT